MTNSKLFCEILSAFVANIANLTINYYKRLIEYHRTEHSLTVCKEQKEKWKAKYEYSTVQP